MEFEQALLRHFTAAELVDFLNIETETVLDRFIDEIYDHFDELAEEVGYESDDYENS